MNSGVKLEILREKATIIQGEITGVILNTEFSSIRADMSYDGIAVFVFKTRQKNIDSHMVIWAIIFEIVKENVYVHGYIYLVFISRKRIRTQL